MIIAYLFGCIAMLSLAFAYQQKKRKKIIINKLIADVCWAIHYSLLGAYGGVIPNAVGILRELTFIKRDEKKWANHIALPIIFILLNLGLGVLTFKNPLNVMPIVASVFVTVSLWLRKPKLTKLITLPVCTTFLIYDALIGSYVGVINEAISIFSISIDFIKNFLKKEYQIMKGTNIFSKDYETKKTPIFIKDEPIREYGVYIEPQNDENAVKLGENMVKEINKNHIADFEKNEEYCKLHGGNKDLMCHVSTLYRIKGKIYVSYYANDSSTEEDPFFQSARIAFCDENDVSQKTILTVQRVGELIENKKVDRVYDTIMLYEGGDYIYVLWTASLDGVYYRLVRTFNIITNTFGDVKVNRLKIGNVINDFSTSGIESGFAENGIPQKKMFSDIGIMQKLSSRTENGKKYYYSGAYSGYLTFIIKTTDFITWEYVSSPDFVNLSLWENATYVLKDKVFYFVRQRDCNQGFLTFYDLNTKKWEVPVLISDCQSRPDFFYYKNKLYLVNAPQSRECIAITEIDLKDISKSKPLLFSNLKSSIFYPFTQVYGDELYISYTVARQHIRLTKIDLKNYIK